VLLLAVLLHLLDVLGGMLTNAGDIPVGANHNVVSILEFRIRVWPAAAKTIPRARWSSS
jgi:hypothetical protein